jgi:hypothetical protein
MIFPATKAGAKHYKAILQGGGIIFLIECTIKLTSKMILQVR